MRLLARALLDAIIPTPSLREIAAARSDLTRHINEPPRRRGFLFPKSVS
jgi:hypothetical protein